jgi:hypothetical protein
MTNILAKIPVYVGVLLVFTAVTVAVLLWIGVTLTMKRLDLPSRTQRTIAILMATILAIWLIASPTLSTVMSQYLPSLRSGAPHIGTFPLILSPIVIGLLLLRLPVWRQIVDAVPLHWLTAIQAYRVVGTAIFLPLMTMGILPAYFAIPASYGDLIPGVSAPLVAYWIWKHSDALTARLRQRAWSWAIALNIFGLLDFIVALGIGSGALYSGLSYILFGERQIVTAHFAYFPLSLIPLFLVPIGIVLHLYSLRRLIPLKNSIEGTAG